MPPKATDVPAARSSISLASISLDHTILRRSIARRLVHHPPSFHAISTQIAARQSHPTTSALIAILGVHFSRLAPRVDSLLDHLQRRSARLAITAA
jgi:hypothetical protein